MILTGHINVGRLVGAMHSAWISAAEIVPAYLVSHVRIVPVTPAAVCGMVLCGQTTVGGGLQ